MIVSSSTSVRPVRLRFVYRWFRRRRPGGWMACLPVSRSNLDASRFVSRTLVKHSLLFILSRRLFWPTTTVSRTSFVADPVPLSPWVLSVQVQGSSGGLPVRGYVAHGKAAGRPPASCRAGNGPAGGRPRAGNGPAGGRPRAGNGPAGGRPRAGNGPAGGRPRAATYRQLALSLQALLFIRRFYLGWFSCTAAGSDADRAVGLMLTFSLACIARANLTPSSVRCSFRAYRDLSTRRDLQGPWCFA